MANYMIHHNVEFIDKNGDVTVMRIPVRHADTFTLANLATEIDGLSTAIGAPGTMTNATLLRKSVSMFETAYDPSAVPALDAEFPSVADKARLTFVSTASGSHLAVALPAPIEALFAAPPADDTVNSGSAISALITWVEAHATDVGGNLYAAYVSGVRSKARARRRKSHRG